MRFLLELFKLVIVLQVIISHTLIFEVIDDVNKTNKDEQEKQYITKRG